MSKVFDINHKRNTKLAREALAALVRFRKTDDEPVMVSMRRMVEEIVPDADPWVVKDITDNMRKEMDELADRVFNRMKDGRQD